MCTKTILHHCKFEVKQMKTIKKFTKPGLGDPTFVKQGNQSYRVWEEENLQTLTKKNSQTLCDERGKIKD